MVTHVYYIGTMSILVLSFFRFAQAVAPNAVAPSPVAASQPSNGTVGSAITMSATGSGVTRTATPSVVQPQNAASASNMASNSQIPTVATAQVLRKVCIPGWES